MAEHSGEKTLDPTPNRRKRARDQGQVVQSQDLTSAGLLLGGLLVLMLTGGALVEFLGRMLIAYLGGDAWLRCDVDTLMTYWSGTVFGLAGVLLLPLGLILALAIALNMLQTGFLMMPQRLAPDWSRVDPFSGFRRLFSLASLVRLSLGIVKIAIVAAVALGSLYMRRDEIFGLVALDVGQIARGMWEISLETCLNIGGALLVVAVLDYVYQRWKHEQDLKMTPQEMREELRNLQGDPQLVARRRSLQRQLSPARLAAAVISADVVISAPNEAAIVIRYNPESMAAPIVVVKGTGALAGQIERLAVKHKVPNLEKAQLARELQREAELNQPIPGRLYSGVAQALAQAYQMREAGAPVGVR